MKKYQILIFALIFIFALYFGYLMFQITWPYFSFEYDIAFLLTKQNVLHLAIWRWAFYSHITISLPIYLVGLFQFLPFIRKKYITIHKYLGRFYVWGVLLVASPSGFVMGLFANGGILAKISFLILSILWFVFTFLQYRYSSNKQLNLHINYSIRGYSLTFSAITFRVLVLILPHFFILPSSQMYAFIAWLSWVPNLLFAEFIIRKYYFSGKILPSL